MSSYSGNQYGQKRLFVFDSNSGTTANFIQTIVVGSGTGDYVSAGGFAVGTTAELQQYVGNVAYLDYKRKSRRSIATLTTEGSGVTSTIIDFTPDPRSIVGVYVSGGSASFTGDHLDEIHITESTGNTYQAFLGKITHIEEDSTLPAGSCLVDLLAYGVSGSDTDGTQFDYTIGNIIENKTNGITSTLKVSKYKKYIDLDSYRQKIINQVGISLDGSGVTSATFGSQHVYFPTNSRALFDYTSALLPAFAHGASAADSRVKQDYVFTLLAGTSGDVSTNTIFEYGVTFNATGGGTLAYSSEFEEFAHYIIHSKAKRENEKGSIIYTITNKNSIRGIDQVSF